MRVVLSLAFFFLLCVERVSILMTMRRERRKSEKFFVKFSSPRIFSLLHKNTLDCLSTVKVSNRKYQKIKFSHVFFSSHAHLDHSTLMIIISRKEKKNWVKMLKKKIIFSIYNLEKFKLTRIMKWSENFHEKIHVSVESFAFIRIELETI